MEEDKMEIFANVPNSRQSPARARYRRPESARGTARRYRPKHISRSGRPRDKSPTGSFKEKLVLQATICGGFLALLLIFNLIDTTFTNGITGWIGRNISHDMLAEEGGFGAWVDSVLGNFRDDAADDIPLPIYSEMLSIDAIPATQTTPQVDHSVVDENILREINSFVDIYYENNR